MSALPSAVDNGQEVSRVRALKWWPKKFTDGRFFRFDAFGMGEPDFHAYIVRYKCEVPMYGSAWCWTLTMPRANGNTYTGWGRSPAEAKKQVAAAIKEHWL